MFLLLAYLIWYAFYAILWILAEVNYNLSLPYMQLFKNYFYLEKPKENKCSIMYHSFSLIFIFISISLIIYAIINTTFDNIKFIEKSFIQDIFSPKKNVLNAYNLQLVFLFFISLNLIFFLNIDAIFWYLYHKAYITDIQSRLLDFKL